MGYFLTDRSRIWQTNIDGRWKLVDNELYMNNNGVIQICPRYFWTDGYTFPNILMPITGDKNHLDVRPAHGHDLECRFHERLVVNLTLSELCRKGYLNNKTSHNQDILVCEDIPMKYITIEKVTKKQANDRLYEMMRSAYIDEYKAKAIRLGVVFNFNWARTGKKSLSEYNIYKEDIGLVNGL